MLIADGTGGWPPAPGRGGITGLGSSFGVGLLSSGRAAGAGAGPPLPGRGAGFAAAGATTEGARAAAGGVALGGTTTDPLVLVDGLPTGTGVADEPASRVPDDGVAAGRLGMLGRATPPAGVAALDGLLAVTTGAFVPAAGVAALGIAGAFAAAFTLGFAVVGAGPTTGAFAGVLGIAAGVLVEPVGGRTGVAAGRAGAAGFAALALGSAGFSSPVLREYPGIGGGKRRGGGGESFWFDTGLAFRAPDVGTRTLAP